MPDPHDNAKMTGDMHPPEVESELPMEQGGDSSDAPGTGGTARGRGTSNEGRPARGTKKAGVLKDRGDEASESSGTTRESGEDTTGRRE